MVFNYKAEFPPPMTIMSIRGGKKLNSLQKR